MFDEATSNLDTFTEFKINDNINEFLKTPSQSFNQQKRTSITIAHRLMTVYQCDVIFVLDKGKVVETGTHNELIENCGLYKRMWDTRKINDEDN